MGKRDYYKQARLEERRGRPSLTGLHEPTWERQPKMERHRMDHAGRTDLPDRPPVVSLPGGHSCLSTENYLKPLKRFLIVLSVFSSHG